MPVLRAGNDVQGDLCLILGLEDPGDADRTKLEIAHQDRGGCLPGKLVAFQADEGIKGDRQGFLPDGQVAGDLQG
jgi:hypothetical protein